MSLSAPPSISAENIPIRPIQMQTLAFLDLETTGLVMPRRPPPRITELAIVALHRDEFLRSIRQIQGIRQEASSRAGNEGVNGSTTSQSNGSQQPSATTSSSTTAQPGANAAVPSAQYVRPRVLQKLLQSINPEIAIDPIASKISKLTSADLVHMPTIARFAPALASFLSALPKPVCLIAHNGARFDMPVLKTELIRANVNLDEDGIYWADSMALFKQIDDAWFKERRDAEKAAQAQAAEEAARGQNETTPMEVTTQEVVLQEVAINAATVEVTGNQSKETTTLYRSRFVSVNGTPGTDYEMSPPRPLNGGTNDVTPKKDPIPAQPPPQQAPEPASSSNQEHVRRRLFDDGPQSISSAKSMIMGLKGSTGYSLKAIHNRIFDGKDPPEHHSAEGDCLSLMQIAAQYGEDFLSETDRSMKPFKDVVGIAKQ